MTPKQTWWYFLGFSGFLLITMGLVALLSPTPSVNFNNSVAVLATISGVAVGIERVLEAFWTFIGQIKGSWWPVSLVSERVGKLVSGLDSTLAPFYEEANKAIKKISDAEKWTSDQFETAKKELDELKGRMDKLKKLVPDNQGVNLIAASTFNSINYLQTKYVDLQKYAPAANQAIIGISDFVATFKDNPGRRVISIYIGTILGLIVAGTIGLDVFNAAMGAKATTWGIIITGLVMGLGSNPTHEFIRALQEIKKSRKADNDPRPTVVDTGVLTLGDLPSPSIRVSTFSLRHSR